MTVSAHERFEDFAPGLPMPERHRFGELLLLRPGVSVYDHLPCGIVPESVFTGRNSHSAIISGALCKQYNKTLAQMSSTFSHTREARAERLREIVRELVEKSSLRQAEAITGVKVGAIRGLLEGRTPQENTLSALEAWERRAGGEELPGSVPPPAPFKPIWLSGREIGQIVRQIRKRLGWSQQRLAEYLGTEKGQAEVSRWERGVRRPGLDKLAMIAGLIGERLEIFQEPGERPAAVREDAGSAYGAQYHLQDETLARSLVEHFEGLVRQMGGAGDIDPAELKLRRLDALEGLRRMFSAAGAVPGWWFRLKDQVEKDEL